MYLQKVKSKFTPKKLLILVGALLVIGIFIALEASGTINVLKTSADSSDAANDGDSPYPATTDEEREQIDNDKTDPSKQPPENKPPSSDGDAKISSASQSSSGADVIIKTQLNGTGWSSCKLTLTRGASTITKTSETLYQSDFSTCLGFSIPASEFNASGEWQVELEATKTDGTTVSASKSITVLK